MSVVRKGFGEVFSDYVFYVALPVEIFLTTLKSGSDYGPGMSGYVQAYAVAIFLLWVVIFVFYKYFLKKGTVEVRSEEHTSELQSLMRISYAVFCLKKNNQLNSLILWK